MSVLLRADDLTLGFAVRRGLMDTLRGGGRVVQALAGVTLSVNRGETLAVVGESGCGKSTLARALVRLLTVDGGQIDYDGQDVRALRGGALRVHRMVPADRVGARVAELLHLVRLPAAAVDRQPHEFSGGQRQRIAIARALAVEPELLIADEIVSALDVSVQAQVLNLLLDMQETLGLAILFVSHDLRVVRHLAHQVAVMYLGRVVEHGPAERVFEAPLHPYTEALLRAAPTLDTRRRGTDSALRGELPSPLRIPPGCPFHPRCPHAFDRCRIERPAMRVRPGQGGASPLAASPLAASPLAASPLAAGHLAAGHLAACHLVEC